MLSCRFVYKALVYRKTCCGFIFAQSRVVEEFRHDGVCMHLCTVTNWSRKYIVFNEADANKSCFRARRTCAACATVSKHCTVKVKSLYCLCYTISTNRSTINVFKIIKAGPQDLSQTAQ